MYDCLMQDSLHPSLQTRLTSVPEQVPHSICCQLAHMWNRVVCQPPAVMQNCGQLRSNMLGQVLEDVRQACEEVC